MTTLEYNVETRPPEDANEKTIGSIGESGGVNSDSFSDEVDYTSVDSGDTKKPNGTVDPMLAEFMESLSSLEEPSISSGSKKKKVTKLPGFLFPDGKAQVIEPGEVDQTVQSDVVLKFGSGEDECTRLTNKIFSNSFEVLGLPVEASEADIRKAFKKLSLLVHPDKCQHPRAKEAFHAVNKAYEDLQRPEMKEKYRAVFEEAKKKVLTDLAATNKARAKANESLFPTDDDSIRDAVTAMCEKMIAEMKEDAEYAERCRRANEEWEKKVAEEMELEEQKQREQKRKWDETRDARVEDWREFKEDVETKRFKVAAFMPVHHRREQRKPGDRTVPSKPRGIDESYKQNWR